MKLRMNSCSFYYNLNAQEFTNIVQVHKGRGNPVDFGKQMGARLISRFWKAYATDQVNLPLNTTEMKKKEQRCAFRKQRTQANQTCVMKQLCKTRNKKKTGLINNIFFTG